MRIDPAIVQHQIENLRTACPDLWGDEEAFDLALSSETELDEFLTKLVRMIDDAKALIVGTKERMEELTARQDRFKRRIEAYRSLIFKLMETTSLKKRELPDATLSIRAGQQRVVITDEAALPDTVCTFVRKPDLTLIKSILGKPGPALPGAELSNAEPSLSIRVK